MIRARRSLFSAKGLYLILAALLLIASIGVAVSCFQKGLFKFLTLDEALEAGRAHMIASDGFRGPEKVFGEEGLTHPPFFVGTLALLFRIIGETEAVARGFGLFLHILIAAILLRIYWLLGEGQSGFFKKMGLYLCLVLYCVNPLLVQHCLLVDADTTWTPFFTIAFVAVFAGFEKTKGRVYVGSRLLLGIFLAFAFLSKEMTPLFLVIAVVLYRLLNREWKKLAVDFVVMTLSAVAVTVLIDRIYKVTTGIPLEFFFRKQYQFRVGRVTPQFLQKVLKSLPLISRWPLFWTTVPFFVALACSLIAAFGRFWKEKRLRMVDFCLIAGLVVWTPFYFVKPSIDMMKYQHSCYSLFILAIVWNMLYLLEPHRESIVKTLSARAALIVPVCILVFAVFFVQYDRLGDYIYLLRSVPTAPAWRTFLASYFLPLGIVFGAVLVATAIFRRKLILISIFFASVFVSVPIALALDHNQQKKDYVTVESWLNYGETGLRETIDYLTPRLKEGSVVAMRNDVDYYIKYRHNIAVKSCDLGTAFGNPVWVLEFFKTSRFDYLVIDNVSQSYLRIKDSPMLLVLARYYRLDAVFGDFKIFAYKGRTV